MAISTPMETVNHVKLNFDTYLSYMPTPFKEYFVTMNEDHTSITLYGIDYSITIQGNGTVK